MFNLKRERVMPSNVYVRNRDVFIDWNTLSFFAYSYQKYIKKPRQNCRHRSSCFYSRIYIYIHTISMFLFSGHDARLLEEKWKSEQVDRRNRRRNITTHLYIYTQREKSSRIKNIAHAREKEIYSNEIEYCCYCYSYNLWETWKIINS
jgi:hypothetical protein